MKNSKSFLKRHWRNITFAFISVCTIVCSSVLLSLGSQDFISNIKTILEEEVYESGETTCFTIKKAGKRIESFVPQTSLRPLMQKYYSSCLASRYLKDSLYLAASCGEKTFKYSISLLDSVDKCRDNSFYIAHGALLPIETENKLVDNYQSSYSFLTSTNDAIYFPEILAKQMTLDFGLSNFKELLYSENSSMGYLNSVSFSIKTPLDDDFSLKCCPRGVYDDQTETGKIFNGFSFFQSAAVCSSGIIDTLSFLPNELLVMLKPNLRAKGNYQNFFDLLSANTPNRNLEFDFSLVGDIGFQTSLKAKLTAYNGKFYNKFYYLFYLFGSLPLVAFLVYLCLAIKKGFLNPSIAGYGIPALVIFVMLLERLIEVGVVLPTAISLYCISAFAILTFCIFLATRIKVVGKTFNNVPGEFEVII